MNLHIVLGLVGSGIPYISEKLQKTIIAKSGVAENLIEIKFGGFTVWDETKKYNYDGWNKRLKKFEHNNPHVQDVVLLGPGAILNAKRFVEDYESVTLYFLEKHQDIPWDLMLENFYDTNKLNLGGNQDNWKNFINQVVTSYNELKTIYNPQLEAFLDFKLDQSQSILVEADTSDDSKIQKFVGLVKVK
jgi:hypothetical protein